MSEIKQLLDEYGDAERFALSLAAQWKYVATLLMVSQGEGASLIFTESERDVGDSYLEVNEIADGELSVFLREGGE